jgi:hypothetical protein
VIYITAFLYGLCVGYALFVVCKIIAWWLKW